MVTQEQVTDALRNCYDPEIPLSIVDLGLVYEVRVDGGDVYVKMTLTAPGCPLHATISQSVKQEIEKLEEVERATVEVVWQPPWTPERMSTDAKNGWVGETRPSEAVALGFSAAGYSRPAATGAQLPPPL